MNYRREFVSHDLHNVFIISKVKNKLHHCSNARSGIATLGLSKEIEGFFMLS